MGFKIAIFPVTCLLIAAKAMQKAMDVLRDNGTTQELLNDMMPFEDFNRLIGFPEIRLFEDKYK